MPYRRRRKPKKPTRKRRYKSNRMVKYTGQGLTKSYPVGKTFKFRTRYVETLVSINPGAGGTADSHVFSMNGLFDPDITGAGHQPLGFDQLVGTMYNHYTVIGSRARITATNTDSTYAQTLVAHLKDTATVSTDISQVIENGLCRWTQLGTAQAGNSTKTLVLNCSPTKFFGRKVLQDDVFRGDSSSNPSEQVYLHITGAPVNAVDSADMRLSVEIEYIAILTEPRELTQS